MPVVSHSLKLTGVLDMVEFHKSTKGVKIKGQAGLYQPFIVEYKKGKTLKKYDVMQLTAQVMALEEQLNTIIKVSYLYYFGSRRREEVEITQELREELLQGLAEMTHYYEEGKVFKAPKGKKCTSCSLVNLCMPKLTQKPRNVGQYLTRGKL